MLIKWFLIKVVIEERLQAAPFFRKGSNEHFAFASSEILYHVCFSTLEYCCVGRKKPSYKCIRELIVHIHKMLKEAEETLI